MRRAWAWITAGLVIIIWNVIFDRAIARGAGEYVHAAAVSAESGQYVMAGDWMRPVTSRALWWANAGAGGMLILCLIPAAIASKKRADTPTAGD